MEAGNLVSEEGVNPVAHVTRKPSALQHRRKVHGVEVVIEPGDVEEEESPCIVGVACGLDAVNKDHNGVNGSVVGS